MLITPVLPIVRFAQMQLVRRVVLRCQGNKDIAMLARLRWRTWRLVRHDVQGSLVELIVIIIVIIFRLGKLDISGNPMADLAPFWVVSAWRIRITHGNRELWLFTFAPDTRNCIDELYFRLFLRFGWVDCVAILCTGVFPRDRDCQQR